MISTIFSTSQKKFLLEMIKIKLIFFFCHPHIFFSYQWPIKYFFFLSSFLTKQFVHNIILKERVLVACPETSLINSKEFLQPIITPFEFELACNTSIQWSGRLITDYRDLLGEQEGQNSSASNIEEEEEGEGDVSLITGKVRTASKATELHSEGQLTVINDKTIRWAGCRVI